MSAKISHFRSTLPDIAPERHAACFTNKVPRPLLAQMRSADRIRQCLLFEVDRTQRRHREIGAFDPKRKLI